MQSNQSVNIWLGNRSGPLRGLPRQGLMQRLRPSRRCEHARTGKATRLADIHDGGEGASQVLGLRTEGSVAEHRRLNDPGGAFIASDVR